jgi:group I intron endonuclease
LTEFFKNLILDCDKKLSGIYKITNTINRKVYIGKTINFQKRYTSYKGAFKKGDIRKINPYFLNSIRKHGPENFTFEVVESCSTDSLSEKELQWMVHYKSTDQQFGYNLRMDSSTGMVTHPSTSKKISERIKKEYSEGIRSREAVSLWAKDLWKDEDRKDAMRRNVSLATASYFIQKTREGECIAVWSNINQILENNPGYKWQNIYAACNGSKASYMKFLWERSDDLPENLVEFLVTDDFTLASRDSGAGFFDQENAPNKADWLYLVYRQGMMFEILGREARKIFPSLAGCFSRNKSNKVNHKGCLIEKIPFVPHEDKPVSHYLDQASKLLDSLK